MKELLHCFLVSNKINEETNNRLIFVFEFLVRWQVLFKKYLEAFSFFSCNLKIYSVSQFWELLLFLNNLPPPIFILLFFFFLVFWILKNISHFFLIFLFIFKVPIFYFDNYKMFANYLKLITFWKRKPPLNQIEYVWIFKRSDLI